MSIEQFREFASQHGGKPLRIGGRLLLPDGCWATDGGGMYVFCEPPSEGRRLAFRIDYQIELLTRMWSDFKTVFHLCRGGELQRNWKWNEQLYGPSSGEPADDLAHLRQLLGGHLEKVRLLLGESQEMADTFRGPPPEFVPAYRMSSSQLALLHDIETRALTPGGDHHEVPYNPYTDTTIVR